MKLKNLLFVVFCALLISQTLYSGTSYVSGNDSSGNNLALAAMVTPASAQNWDFSLSYQNVYSTNALNYVTEQVNMQMTSEGDITYWNPVNNGAEARLTQKFSFTQPTSSAFLHMNYIYIANFGGGSYGSGSLWGSKNGSDWLQLVDAPTPSSIAAGYNYDGMLPESLMGNRDLWIQARLNTSGWNIMAQFLRYDVGWRTDNAFDLKVALAPEPSALSLLAVGFGGLALVRRRRS